MEVRTVGHFIRINRKQRPCTTAVLAHACHVLSGCRCKFRISTDQQFRIWLRSIRLNVAETGFECATLAWRSWLYAITGVGLEYDFHLFTPWEIDGAQIVWMPVFFSFSNLWMNSNTHPIPFITLNQLPHEHDTTTHTTQRYLFQFWPIEHLLGSTSTHVLILYFISVSSDQIYAYVQWMKPTNRRINSISCTLKTCVPQITRTHIRMRWTNDQQKQTISSTTQCQTATDAITIINDNRMLCER